MEISKPGRRAEAAVASYLERRGAQVLARNFRGRRGEIDLIVRDGATLVFVEVKARRAGAGLSLAAVDVHKQRRIAAVALEYLVRRRLLGVPVRFDVAGVRLVHNGDPVALIYVPHAFELELGGSQG